MTLREGGAWAVVSLKPLEGCRCCIVATLHFPLPAHRNHSLWSLVRERQTEHFAMQKLPLAVPPKSSQWKVPLLEEQPMEGSVAVRTANGRVPLLQESCISVWILL